MIRCVDMVKTYRMGDVEVRALNGVSLSIGAGEFVAIMGPSGSGKTTLMNMLGLLDVPDSGVYEVEGQNVARLDDDALSRLRSATIGFVFQQFNLLSRTSAIDNVSLPLIYNENGGEAGRAAQLLKEVGLGSRMHHKPNELSGGQQQRVAIARSLINAPKVILADEPTGNLDSTSQEEIMALLAKLNAAGITVILITHEEEVALHARRIIRMRDGKILSDELKPGPSPRLRAETGEDARKIPHSAPQRGEGLGARFLRETKDHFRQAFRSLGANKVRTFLSMLGILIGVAAVIAMLALGAGAQKDIEKRLASLGSNLLMVRPGASQSQGVALDAGTVTRFTAEDAQAISQFVPHANRVSASVNGRARVEYGDKNWSTQMTGSSASYAPMRASGPEIGRFYTDAEDTKREKVAVIGMTIVRQLFNDASGKSVNPIGEYINLNHIKFQVIGILPEKGNNGFRDQDDIIMTPLLTAMKRVLGKDYVDSIDIEVDNRTNIPEVQQAVTDLLMRRHRLQPYQADTIQIRNMADVQETVAQTGKTMSFLLASIAVISLLVGGIGIMNIMLVSVTERTREIGLRKAVGARYIDIMLQFLIEAVVVSVGGGMIGIALGWLISFAMSNLAGWPVSFSPLAVILAFVFSALVGIGFGLWPARKAAGLNPIEALRYE